MNCFLVIHLRAMWKMYWGKFNLMFQPRIPAKIIKFNSGSTWTAIICRRTPVKIWKPNNLVVINNWVLSKTNSFGVTMITFWAFKKRAWWNHNIFSCGWIKYDDNIGIRYSNQTMARTDEFIKNCTSITGQICHIYIWKNSAKVIFLITGQKRHNASQSIWFLPKGANKEN